MLKDSKVFVELDFIKLINTYFDAYGMEIKKASEKQGDTNDSYLVLSLCNLNLMVDIDIESVAENQIYNNSFMQILTQKKANVLVLIVNRLNTEPMVCVFSKREIELGMVDKIEVLSRMKSKFDWLKELKNVCLLRYGVEHGERHLHV